MIRKELRNKAIEMLESGIKPMDVVRELKISRPTVYALADAIGLMNREPVEKKTNFAAPFIEEFFEDWKNATADLTGRYSDESNVIDKEFACDFYREWIQAVNKIRRYYRKPILVTWKLEV